MKCRKCGADTREGWRFCPRCGSILGEDLFASVFSRMERELKEMDRVFERNLEVFDLSPFFRKPVKGRGFSINITRSSGEKPRVSVKTFGNVDIKEIEEEVKKLGLRERLGTLRPRVRESEEPKAENFESRGGVCISGAKTTEEPKTCVKRIGDRIAVEVELPDVKDESDIELKTLENSIEIKARAGDKAYFKILTKPPQTSVTGKRFRNGILRLELS
ncbi:MAG: zinc-ribbon domain-containing protein [Candidatus Aenigmarchaeota archaeon]|nr:zinc-ribbon domain-containing protein [Candidatus Aenigmarchaeota archaeon]NIP40118.1 zinc-ribbon domain-containing protein [Candidatus Aenigmarchaeota archaeon]NIQ18195.1 zinc-ribbon domain-containing protein [Candidatus Aenigmarchaeota archaeon]NIS72952.1 zinc-ribbon domain-containing protein [Candidatus Aenigmarchaeota archaeon]